MRGNVFILAGGTGLAQLIMAACMPLLTRLYSPADFGIFTIYSSIFGIMLAGIALRFDIAVPIPSKERHAVGLAVLGLAAVCLISCGFGSAMLFCQKLITSVLPTGESKTKLLLISLGLVGAGSYSVLNYYALRSKKFSDVSTAKVAQGATQSAVQLAASGFAYGELGLILGDVVGRISGAVMLVKSVGRHLYVESRHLTKKDFVEVLCLYRRFPMLSVPSGVLNTSGLLIFPLFLGSLYGPDVAGHYGLGHRLISIPIALIGIAVSQVYLVKAAEIAHSPRRLFELFSSVAMRLFSFAIVPAILLLLGANWATPFIFGDKWREAGPYIESLSVMFLFQFVASPLSQTLNIVGRLDLQLYWDAGRLLIVIGSIVACKMLTLTALTAVWVYSINVSLSYVLLFIICKRTLCKRLCEFA